MQETLAKWPPVFEAAVIPVAGALLVFAAVYFVTQGFKAVARWVRSWPAGAWCFLLGLAGACTLGAGWALPPHDEPPANEWQRLTALGPWGWHMPTSERKALMEKMLDRPELAQQLFRERYDPGRDQAQAIQWSYACFPVGLFLLLTALIWLIKEHG